MMFLMKASLRHLMPLKIASTMVKIDSASASDPDDSSKAPDVPENGKDNVKINYASASDLDDSIERKNHSSIDHALASALAAFLTSKLRENARDHYDPSDAKERDTSSYVGTIPEETDDLIKNSKLKSELEPDTEKLDSMLSALTDSDTPGSDHENDKFNMSDIFSNSSAFDDSSGDESDLSLPSSKAHSGLKILAPEFPSDDDASVDSDDSDPNYKGHHNKEEFMTKDSILISAFTALDPPSEFKTSSSIITSAVAGEDANQNDISAISFLVGATSRGTEETYSHNYGDQMNNVIDCDYILHSLQLEEGLKYKPRKHDHSIGPQHGNPTTVPCQFNLEEIGSSVKLHLCCSPAANETDNEHLVQEMAQPLSVKSDYSSIMKSHDEGILYDTCHGNTSNSHISYSQTDGRWEESRTSPQGSVLESHKNHVHLAESSERTFLAGLLGLNGRVLNENTCCRASDGVSPDGVQKHFFSYMPSYNDSLVNVKLDSDQSLRSDLPLDILLGERYISEVQSSDSKDLNNYVGESYYNDHFTSEGNPTSGILQILLQIMLMMASENFIC